MPKRDDPPPGKGPIDSEAEIDGLYQVPQSEFTTARNALAARLKAAGDAQAAARVKTLDKPTISAWAINQLYWRARKAFDAMTAAGDRLRAAQRKLLMGGANRTLADLTREREAAIGDAVSRAADFLREAGHEPNQSLRQRLGMTLDVIATEGSKSAAPRGRWTADLTPSGFGALAALVPASATPLRLIEFPAERRVAAREEKTVAKKTAARQAQIERARATLAQAESELRAREGEAERAEEAEKEAATRLSAARADVDEARGRLDEATRRADQADKALQQARQRARDAAAEIKDARKTVTSARKKLDISS